MSIDPPRPRGPSLNALRAFEAAARLGGFSKAADELSVSPGAIAQHVKTLEDWAGAPLFTRHAQGLSLTDIGAEAHSPLIAAFDQMGEAVQSLRALASPGEIHIAALPAIAQLWLSPRLPALRTALPDVTLSVTALETPPNLTREPFDLAIFHGNSGGDIIVDDLIFPVCTPDLAAQLTKPADLAALPCLRDSTWSGDWGVWMSQAMPDNKPRLRGPRFSLYALAVQEALNGAGVLMAHGALVQDHLTSGALVAPFEHRINTGNALRLMRRSGPTSGPMDHLCALLTGERRL